MKSKEDKEASAETGAFDGCKNLTDIAIRIGGGTKPTPPALISRIIIIPKNATEIMAYECMPPYTSIIIPENIAKIHDKAFLGGTIYLQNIVINTKDESKFERIKQLLPEELKRHVVPMSVYAQAKQFKEKLLDEFCNQTSGIDPLDGHLLLPADVVGVISASSDEFAPATRLQNALDAVGMPTSDLLSEYKEYTIKLSQVQAEHLELIPPLIRLYDLKNLLLKYKKSMEAPTKPPHLRPIGFFGGPPPNEQDKNLPTWTRHHTLTEILDWIDKIIDSYPLLADVSNLALSEKEKTAIARSPMLMESNLIPGDFNFKAMIMTWLTQKEPPSANAGSPALK